MYRAQFDPRESSLSMRIVRGLVEAVEQVGVSRVELLNAAQLEPAQLEREDACLPSQVVYRVCEHALELTRDPAFGLHWTERLSEATFNPVSHLVAHSSTLRQAFESLHRFHRLLNDQPSFRLVEHENKVTLQCLALAGASLRVQRFRAEVLVLGLVRLIRSFSAGARLDAVNFEYARPEYHEEYTRSFGQPPRFDQAFTGIVFDRALMSIVSLHHDEDVHDALRLIAERRIRRLTEHAPFTSRVRDLLVEEASRNQPDMGCIARKLGFSRRSLRRRLVSEGSSYKAIVKEALAIVAKQYLRDQKLTIQETAYEMGFADTSAFHRAFKRWTGRTPSAYRDQQFDHPAWNPPKRELDVPAVAANGR